MKYFIITLFLLGVFLCSAQENAPFQFEKMPEEENAVLAQVLKLETAGQDGLVVVSPHTCWPYNPILFDPADTNRLAEVKEHILCQLHCTTGEVGGLIDQLFEKNAVFYRLTLPNREDQRYVIDYDGTLSKPVNQNQDESLPFDLRHPPQYKYDILIGVSHPAIDPANGRVLIYVIRGNGAGIIGDILLYEEKGGQLEQIRRGSVVCS